jgi:hypothetical protein
MNKASLVYLNQRISANIDAIHSSWQSNIYQYVLRRRLILLTTPPHHDNFCQNYSLIHTRFHHQYLIHAGIVVECLILHPAYHFVILCSSNPVIQDNLSTKMESLRMYAGLIAHKTIQKFNGAIFGCRGNVLTGVAVNALMS